MKKLVVGIAGLALAGGLGLAGAGPALAGTGDGQVVRHATGGLGGSVGVMRADSSQQIGIPETGLVSWNANNSPESKHIKYVKAGSGYCVWEQSYSNNGTGDPRSLKIADTTHGKGYSSRWWQLAASNRITGNYPQQESITTDLRIFRC